MKKLTAVERANILSLRSSGMTVSEVAVVSGVSDKTVKRIMAEQKKCPAVVDSNGEGKSEKLFDVSDDTTKWTSREKILVAKMSREKELYEDDTEGWTYHVTAQQLADRSGALWWWTIVYPESAPEDWREKLRQKCLMCGWQVAISPLHDKDVWTHDSPKTVIDGLEYAAGARYRAGDVKKSHWHVIIKLPIKVKYMAFATVIQDLLHCPYPQRVGSLKGAYDYLVHAGQPDKYQYEISEIERMGGFCVEPTVRERAYMLGELLDRIHREEIYDFDYFCSLYVDQVDYISVIGARAACLKYAVDGVYHRKFPYRGVE